MWMCECGWMCMACVYNKVHACESNVCVMGRE